MVDPFEEGVVENMTLLKHLYEAPQMIAGYIFETTKTYVAHVLGIVKSFWPKANAECGARPRRGQSSLLLWISACEHEPNKYTHSDEDISHGIPLKNIEQDPQPRGYTYERPMTQAKAKQLQHEVNLFLNDYEHASHKNHVLPNGGTLLVLRFESQVKDMLST
jgi:hypothetical protein